MTGIASPSASPLRDFIAPRLASIQPEVSEAYRAEYSWAGMPVITDQLALVMVNDTRRAWEGQWGVERRRLDGTVLATQITRVTDRQGSRPRWFWRPPWSPSVAPPRRFWCSAPTGQVLLGSFTIRPGSSPGPPARLSRSLY